MKIKIVTPQHGNAVSWTAALRDSDESFDVCSELRPLHTVNVLVNGSRPDLVCRRASQHSRWMRWRASTHQNRRGVHGRAVSTISVKPTMAPAQG